MRTTKLTKCICGHRKSRHSYIKKEKPCRMIIGYTSTNRIITCPCKKYTPQPIIIKNKQQII